MTALCQWLILLMVDLRILYRVQAENLTDDEPGCLEKWSKEGLDQRFSDSQIIWMCQQRKQLQTLTSAQRDSSSTPTNSQMAYLDFIGTCEGVRCLQPFDRDRLHSTGAGTVSKTKCQYPTLCDFQNDVQERSGVAKVLRKEYRMLSEIEKRSLHDAFNRLKFAKIDNVSKYDLLASWHYPTQSPGAHWGPAFLPWHREYLRRIEVALRNEIPNVAIPYWDSTLDYDLPDPRDSTLWTEANFGNGNGFVTTGPFANWSATMPLPDQPNVNKLYRRIGESVLGGLMRPTDLNWLYSRQSYSQLTSCVDPTFELTHGLTHVWVGGYMLIIRVSTNDPVFFFHHAFVDFIWEKFRQSAQSAQQRISDWSPKDRICSAYHDLDSPMFPFEGMKNRDGLSERYLTDWYGYEDSPKCSKASADCGSAFLWCHIVNEKSRCRAKIRPFGNCVGLDGTEACYQSICLNGICVPKGTNTVIPLIPPPMPPPSPGTDNGEIVFMKTVMFNENGPLSDGSVTVDSNDGQNVISRKSTPVSNSNIRFPEFANLIYAQVSNPQKRQVKAKLTATDSTGTPCRAYCRHSAPDLGFTYSSCSGSLTLSSVAEYSDPVSFSTSETIRPYLDIDISRHPNQWTFQPPFVAFLCGSANDPSIFSRSTQSIKSIADDKGDYVWFHVLVMDGRTPLDRTVPAATINAMSLDNRNPYQYQAKVETDSNFPRYFGAAYVRVPNPKKHQGSVRIQVSATDPFGKPCKPTCDDGGAYEVCKGNVTLSQDETKSNVFSFTSDDNAKLFLGWDLTKHPTQWRRAVSILQFLCYI